MMKLNVIFILLFIISCSGTKQKNISSENKVSLGELDNITDEDFKNAAADPYKSNEDYFHDFDEDYNLLGDESVSRYENHKLTKMATSEDVLSSGIGKCYLGNASEGLDTLEKRYSKLKKNPSYWNQVGTCYLLQNKYRLALLYYNKARSTQKNYIPAINNIAIVHMKMNDDQKAMAALKEATKMAGTKKTPLMNLAILELKYSHVDSACRKFFSLNKYARKDLDLINAIATCHLYKNKYQNAIDEFRRIPGQILYSSTAGLNYALALYKNGHRDMAKEVLGNMNMGKLGTLRRYYERLKEYIGH